MVTVTMTNAVTDPAAPDVDSLPPGVIAVEKLLLQHPAHRLAKEKIAEQHRRARSRDGEGGRLTSTILMILGDTRTGKTRLLEDYMSAFPRISLETVAAGGPAMPPGVDHDLRDAEYRRVVSASAKAGGDLRSFASTLLQAFGYRAKDLWDTTRIISDIRYYATEMKTDLIFIDESHNLLHSNAQTTADVAAFLKDLTNDVPCQVVMAGLEPMKDIVPYAPQLKARIEAPVHLRPYAWGDARGLRNFIKLLQLFEGATGLAATSGLGEFDMARRMYVASLDGRIGWVAKLVSRALLLALRRGHPRLDPALLGEVFASLDFMEEETVEGTDGAGVEPDFLDQDVYAKAKGRSEEKVSVRSDADNPFLCRPERLAEIRRGLRVRTDIERKELERRLAGRPDGEGGRVTGLRPTQPKIVAPFGVR